MHIFIDPSYFYVTYFIFMLHFFGSLSYIVFDRLFTICKEITAKVQIHCGYLIPQSVQKNDLLTQIKILSIVYLSW